GTSMASPHVAGIIALMIQAHPALTYDQARVALENTAVDLGTPGYDYDYGYGRVDALGAVLTQTTDAPDSAGTHRPHPPNRPNPFRDAVTLELAGSSPARVDVRVFDLQGRCVWSTSGRPGEIVRWDGRESGGGTVPAGLYFVNATDGHAAVTVRA